MGQEVQSLSTSTLPQTRFTGPWTADKSDALRNLQTE